MKMHSCCLGLALLCAPACDSVTTKSQAAPLAPVEGGFSPPSSQHQSTDASASRFHDAQAPLVVRVQGPAHVAAGDIVRLTLHIERRGPSTEPLDVSVRLPAGASLAEGLGQETIADTRGTTLTRALTIAIQSVPADDVQVTVDAQGQGYGMHATAAYRFGRPEPKLPQPLSRAQALPGIKGSSIPIPPR